MSEVRGSAWGMAGVRMSLYASSAAWSPSASAYYGAMVAPAPVGPKFLPNYDDLTDEQLAQAGAEYAEQVRGSTLLYSSEEL